MNIVKTLLAAIGAAAVVLFLAIVINIATTPEYPKRTHVSVCTAVVAINNEPVDSQKDCESYDLITYEDGRQVRIPRP